eukprot:Gregarina_sp_Poly_1__552@NODE_1131_length_4993_cov_135_826431_g78_i1_p1_GENE_NODE_1131_length_4993_cov_135_826431_g78_i1NODE_1131_length_4993_cov_135_826431_g78_i1_p1_ORF_typecomplete_len612_score72_27Fbox/PF00646_33/0_093_NODE_1131_length_4993_cov_135_826431_g78_i116473482
MALTLPFELTTDDYEQRKHRFGSWLDLKPVKLSRIMKLQAKSTRRKRPTKVSWEIITSSLYTVANIHELCQLLVSNLNRRQLDYYSALVLMSLWCIEGREVTLARMKSRQTRVELPRHISPLHTDSGAAQLNDWLETRKLLNIRHVADVLMSASVIDFDYQLVDPREVVAIKSKAAVNYFSEAFNVFQEAYSAIQKFLISVFSGEPHLNQVVLVLSDLCRLGRMPPKTALQIQTAFICWGAKSVIALLSLGVYVDCQATHIMELAPHFNNKFLRQSDGQLVLLNVLPFLKVHERFRCREICRFLRSHVHSQRLEEQAMNETLQIALTGLDPPYSCYTFASSFSELQDVSPISTDGFRRLCQSITSWHQMGTRVFRRYQKLLEIDDQFSVNTRRIYKPCEELDVLSIQFSQLSSRGCMRYRLFAYSDVYEATGDQNQMAKNCEGFNILRVGRPDKSTSCCYDHLLPFTIRALLLIPRWRKRFITPFNEYSPPMLFYWAEANFSFSRLVYLPEELPCPNDTLLQHQEVFLLKLEDHVGQPPPRGNETVRRISNIEECVEMAETTIKRWLHDLDTKVARIARRHGLHSRKQWVALEDEKLAVRPGGLGLCVFGN